MLVALVLAALLGSACAQNATTTFVTSVPVRTVSASVSRGSTIPPSTVLSATTIVSTFPTATASASPSSNLVTLDTKIDPAFGVLGAVLILTGLPSAFWGHKNRWSSFFLVGFYTLATVCLVLILRFGVLQAVNPPSETLRGLFVLSCAVAGIVGGGVAIFFWKGTKYFIGAWGGFAFGLFIQALHDGGLIKPLGFRWALYTGCATVGFTICTIPKLHYPTLLAATAMVGATAFILGVDCFTTAGLKEFYVYNLGFKDLFPKFANIEFAVSQTMQIELGMIGAVAVMGAAVQARVLVVLQARLREINAEQERINADAETKAAARVAAVDEELEEWERDHGRGGGRKKADDLEASGTLTPDSHRLSFFKPKHVKRQSSITMADLAGTNATTPKEPQATTPTPHLNLDLGTSVENAIPDTMFSTDHSQNLDARLSEEERKDPELRQKVELLSEIQGIRKTIAALKGDTENRSSFINSDTPRNRNKSLQELEPEQRAPGRRNLSLGSMDALQAASAQQAVTSSKDRPKSTPGLNEWDEYVKSRKLFQPPSGVTPPLQPTPIQPRPHSITMPLAVAEAVEQRQKRERAYESGGPEAYIESSTARPAVISPRPTSGFFGSTPTPQDTSDEDLPLSHRRRYSSGANSTLQPTSRLRDSQVLVLPPAKAETPRAEQPVVKTFEELSARHKEKIKALQEPLSKKEAEEAQIAEARRRWERSKAVERDVMAKREEQKRRTVDHDQMMTERPRSLSSNTLQSLDTAKRPLSSAVKVQEWQKYQDITQQQREEAKPSRGAAPDNRRSRSKSPLPFPTSPTQPRRQSQSFGRLDPTM